MKHTNILYALYSNMHYNLQITNIIYLSMHNQQSIDIQYLLMDYSKWQFK